MQAYFHPAGGSAFLYGNSLAVDSVITAISKRYKNISALYEEKSLIK